MRRFVNWMSDKIIKDDNNGFSLVEIIVAVAILALVFTPILRSFMTSTITNGRAQEIQNATSLAESLMEEVKSKTKAELEAEAASSGEIIHVKDGEGNQIYLDEEKTKELKDYVIKYSNKTATNGKTFDAVVTVSSSNYAKESEDGNVADANIRELPSFSEIDASKNAVLSWELNRYDGAAYEVILDRNAYYRRNQPWDYQLHASDIDGDHYDGIWWRTVWRYLDYFKKETVIKIETDAAKHTMAISSNVGYVPTVSKDDPDENVRNKYFEPIKYNLSTSKYNYITKKKTDAEGNVTEYEGCPDIYLFYTFMYDEEEIALRRYNAHMGGNDGLRLDAKTEFLDIVVDDNFDGDIYFILQPRGGEMESYRPRYEQDPDSGLCLFKYTLEMNSNKLQVKYQSPDQYPYTVSGNVIDGRTSLTVSMHSPTGDRKILTDEHCFKMQNLSGKLYTNMEYTYMSGEKEITYDGNLYQKRRDDKIYYVNLKLYKHGETSNPQAEINSTMPIRER